MSQRGQWQLDRSARRRALRNGVINGALWYAGNALTTGTLVIYLALDLGARGTTLSLILALPALAGVLRLGTPALIARWQSVKCACLVPLLGSYVVLCLLPLLIAAPPHLALAGLIAILCVHQTLEYVGSVALWTWLGELVPRPIRGRYFSRRQMWQLGVAIPTLLASGLFADTWHEAFPGASSRWALGAYTIPFGVGCLLLLASLWPLMAMPGTQRPVKSPSVPWRTLGRTLADHGFRRLLYFGCWLSLANGAIQAAQNIYPKQVLGLPVLPLEAMRIGMRVGQLGVSSWAGRFCDRFGNRPTLLVSQLLLGAAPLFFLLASPQQPWWLAGAWLLWSFYAALNICLPNLALRLSQADDFAPYLAVYFTTTSLCYAGATVAGGVLFDWLAHRPPTYLAGYSLDHYQLLFLGSWLTRTAAVVWLVGIPEPGAMRWGDILSRPWTRYLRQHRSLGG